MLFRSKYICTYVLYICFDLRPFISFIHDCSMVCCWFRYTKMLMHKPKCHVRRKLTISFVTIFPAACWCYPCCCSLYYAFKVITCLLVSSSLNFCKSLSTSTVYPFRRQFNSSLHFAHGAVLYTIRFRIRVRHPHNQNSSYSNHHLFVGIMNKRLSSNYLWKVL